MSAPAPDRPGKSRATPGLPRRYVDVRRAVLGCLLLADRPLTIAEVVDAVAEGSATDALDHKHIADLLRHQVRLRRVRRVDRGVYQIVPGAMSKATEWRCVNWRRERDRAHERWVRDHT